MSLSTQALAQAAGSTVEPAAICLTSVCKSLYRKYRDVRKISEYYETMQRKENRLSARERTILAEIEHTAGAQMTEEADDWFKRVKQKKIEIGSLKTRYLARHQCICGLCPFISLLRLSREISKMNKDIDELYDELEPRNRLLLRRAPHCVMNFDKKLDGLPSQKQHVDNLIKMLEDDQVRRICIWGLPGAGKTTVMEALYDKVRSNMQPKVIWVTLRKRTCVEEILKSIEQQLCMKAVKGSSSIRAGNISGKLKDINYVLFIDNFRSDFKLNEVGIHDDHVRGKIVFTCIQRKNTDVCGPNDDEVQIKGLSNADAQKLFESIVGQGPLANKEIRGLKHKVIQYCSGMPKLICSIGTKLKNVADPAEWRDIWRQLQRPTMEEMHDLEDYMKFFSFVYNDLQPDEKSCLLYWALFPPGHEFPEDYVVDCWSVEELLCYLQNLAEARDRGRRLLNNFVRSCLLEEGSQSRHYKMFVFFQRVALKIANQSSCGMSGNICHRTNKEEWEHAKRVSLIGQEVRSLPENPLCHEISTLLLQKNRELTGIPDLFFVSMSNLQILDLQDTGITLLPLSISDLRNLKALFLNNCRQLRELPCTIGGLENLQVLDARHSGVHNLPDEIRRLSRLKCLRASFSHYFVPQSQVNGSSMISCDTIARLSKLEELCIIVDPDNTNWSNIVEMVVEEVVELEGLTTLQFYFPRLECFTSFLQRSKSWNKNNGGNGFRSFRINIGHYQENNHYTIDVTRCSEEKHLMFSAGRGVPSEILKVLAHAYSFELVGHEAPNLSPFCAQPVDRLNALEECAVQKCNNLECIIDGSMTPIAFQNLRSLYLHDLQNLRYIWKNGIGSESLTRLTTLDIRCCHALAALFSESVVFQLSQLKSLHVEDCRNIKRFVQGGSRLDLESFPELKTIILRNLPQLSQICNIDLVWPSLKPVEIRDCPALAVPTKWRALMP